MTAAPERGIVSPELEAKAEKNPTETFQVIVQTSDPEQIDQIESTVDRAQKKHPGKAKGVKKKFKLIAYASLELTGEQLENVATAAGVVSVTEDAPVAATGYGNRQDWVASVGAQWGPAPKGTKYPTIAVVDSGVEGRGDFGRRLAKQVDFTSTGPNTTNGDGFGHGTMVAGLAVGGQEDFTGAEPRAGVVSLDVLDDSGAGRVSDVIAACDWILENKDKYRIRVANFSLQGDAGDSIETNPLNQAVEKLWLNGIVVVAAAGNDAVAGAESGVHYAPADDPFVITVGAADTHGTTDPGDDFAAPWSSWGSTADGFRKPEISAPGRFLNGPAPKDSLMYTSNPSRRVEEKKRGRKGGDTYMWMSGTSFAAPIVAGAAASVLARHPDWTPDQVKGALMATANVPDGYKSLGALGVGTVNVDAAANDADGSANPNAALNRFVGVDRATGLNRFDASSWSATAMSDPTWNAASWSSASWSSASWSSAYGRPLLVVRVLVVGELVLGLMGEHVRCRVGADEPEGERQMTADGYQIEATSERAHSPGGLHGAALIYLVAVAALAGALGWASLAGVEPLGPKEWLAFALIAVGAAVAQMFPAVSPRNQSYHTTMVVLVPAALLLPFWLLPAVVVAQHVPEWLKVRYPWYIQLFNAGNYLVDLFAAAAVAQLLLGQDRLIRNDELRFAVAGVAAAAVLVLLNHLILSGMLRLARGHSLRESGLFSFESLTTDLVLASLGVLVASAWTISPALIPLALAPLFLIQRSLAVPQLEEEARLDPKTGLLNVRYFSEIFNDRLEQALRTGRPLALLMIDLDLLREINNTYGHLAGDAVLERIAAVFHRDLRSDDIAARFGGEEFVLLLPDTDLEHALALAERVRGAIGRERIRVAAINETLSATVSIGVAMCPRDGTDSSALIHRADTAVYRAKIQGRNRVVDGAADPLSDMLPNTIRNLPLPAVVPDVATGTPAGERRTETEVPISVARPFEVAQEAAGASRRRRIAFGAITAGMALTALGAVVTLLDPPGDVVALLTLAALVVGGQALALQAESGSISVGAVGALAGVALLGGSAAVILALAAVVTDAALRRPPVYTSIYNLGVLTASALGAAFVFGLGPGSVPMFAALVYGVAAGGMYFLVNTSLLSIAIGAEEGRSRIGVWRQSYAWLFPHYLAYGCCRRRRRYCVQRGAHLRVGGVPRSARADAGDAGGAVALLA